MRTTPLLAAAAIALLVIAAPAHAQRSTPVTVVNTDAAPVPVETDTERNVRTPFAVGVNVAIGTFRGIPTSDRVAGDDFTVPAGQILVVEHISLRATTATADQVAFVEVRFTSDGTSTNHNLPVSTDLASLPVGSTQKITSYGWPIKFYADGGSDVVLNLNSTDGSPGGAAGYRVSGYLVPASSATLGH